MNHGLITQGSIQAGPTGPDQRGVDPQPAKTTAHPGAEPPSTPNSEDHNLAVPPDPDGDPEVGNPIIGAEAPQGTEVPGSLEGRSGDLRSLVRVPPFRLGSGAARSRPCAGVRTALRYLPMLFAEHFLNLLYHAFYSRRTLRAFISIHLSRPPWRRVLLACVVVQAYLIGLGEAGIRSLSGTPTIIQACGSSMSAAVEAVGGTLFESNGSDAFEGDVHTDTSHTIPNNTYGPKVFVSTMLSSKKALTERRLPMIPRRTPEPAEHSLAHSCSPSHR